MPDTRTDAKKDEFAGMTAGPWTAQLPISADGDERGNAFIVGANLGGLVAAALPWPTELDSGNFSRVEANARAIAALPRLLSERAALTAEVERLTKELDDLESAWRGANDVIAGQRTHLADLWRERDRLARALRECASRCRYDGDLFHDQGDWNRRDASWAAANLARAALSGAPARGEEKACELPLCLITGRIAGDSDACGDCDPCSAASRVPESIKRLLAEKDEWRAKYGDAAARLDASPVAPVQAEREAVEHSPRCDCGSLFEICRYPNCECDCSSPPTSGSQG